jgi:hypothetical protein
MEMMVVKRECGVVNKALSLNPMLSPSAIVDPKVFGIPRRSNTKNQRLQVRTSTQDHNTTYHDDFVAKVSMATALMISRAHISK